MRPTSPASPIWPNNPSLKEHIADVRGSVSRFLLLCEAWAQRAKTLPLPPLSGCSVNAVCRWPIASLEGYAVLTGSSQADYYADKDCSVLDLSGWAKEFG